MRCILIFLLAISALAHAAGQEKQSGTEAVQVKRKPAPSIVDRYDFSAQLRALQGNISPPASDPNPAFSANTASE